jgi:ABC-type phosphate transport system substrate-binding protein
MFKFSLSGKAILAAIFLLAPVFMRCSASAGQPAKDTTKLSSFGANSNSNVLLGAGSASVFPLFSKLFAEYGRENHVRVNYQAIGPEGGIVQLINKTIDFSDSDMPLNSEQAKKAGSLLLYIPVCTGAKASASKPAAHGKVNYVSIYKEQNYDGRSLQRAQKILKMLWWDVHEGQKYCKELNYTPLSQAAVLIAEKALKSATFDGKPILQ